MTDISAKYLGLTLSSPVIAGSSDFTASVKNVVEMANAGAGAVVLKSIFEEQILMEIDAQRTNNMFNSYSDAEHYVAFYTRQHEVRAYLELIRDAKKETGIPVIASVHCSSGDSWVSFISEIEKAGADAVELNVFMLPSNVNDTDDMINNRYLNIVDSVRKTTGLPIALKVHHYFTGMANFLVRLSEKSQALVLFNRFFNPDINIDTLTIGSAGNLSVPSENGMVQRWIGILRPHVKGDLAATTGIHDGAAVVKNLLAEAIVSMNLFLKNWMKEHQFKGLNDFKGSLSQRGTANPEIFERAQFMKYFSSAGIPYPGSNRQ
jgi:dihydroorotate dehydrogenase (fumarate)